MKIKIFFLCICIISLFGYLYLNNNVKISNSYEVVSYSNDYEIGSIKIPTLGLNRKIMQGLDNKYYLNHNYLNMDSDSGEFFLDTYGDLINNNNSIIYTNKNNIDINNLRINDILNINYLDNFICYKILSVNKKMDHDLIIKVINDNNEFNIFLLKVDC